MARSQTMKLRLKRALATIVLVANCGVPVVAAPCMHRRFRSET
jgi:hypothetical protein